MTTPLLDFETLAPPRPTIRIDKVEYKMALLGDFGLREQARLARLIREASTIEAEVADRPAAVSTGNADTDKVLDVLDAVGEVTAAKVVAFLDEVVTVILPKCPTNVLARLSERQKRSVIEAFMPAVLGTAAPTETPAPVPNPLASTSGSSRRTSQRRTARGRG